MKKLLLGFIIGALIGSLTGFFVHQYLFHVSDSTVLIELVKRDGRLEEMREVLKERGPAALHERDEKLRTPLWHALNQGNLEAAKYLLDEGADLMVNDFNNVTPFMVAAQKGLERVKFLYNNNQSLNAVDKRGNIPLMFAAKSGNLAVVTFLVEKGGDVMGKNKEGQTAEDIARLNGHEKIADYLKKVKERKESEE